MEKIFFKTRGCSNNFHESEVMMGLLNKAGFQIVDNPQEADLIVINICTVKGSTNALRDVKEIHETFKEKKLIIAGCITKSIIPEIRKITGDASLISTHNITKIIEVVEETLHENAIEAVAKAEEEKLLLPKLRQNKIIGIVPILSGCTGYCSYCSVRLIKGKLFSYTKEHILEEVENSLKEGCKEIWITSQDNAAYGLDSDKPLLVDLLKEIVALPYDFKIRIGMMNPDNVLLFLDDLIEIYKNKKIFKFLHIPVQSGNDEILELMKRRYHISNFKWIVEAFRDQIPDITIATDIIVGFPSETEEQFNDSLNLIKELKPNVLNRSKYVRRPGTDASKLKEIEGGIVKNRSRILTDIFGNVSRMNNEKWIDWQGDILIDEIGKDNTWVGRNHAYKPVIISGMLKLGDKVKVRIKAATVHDLRGEVIP